MFDLNNAAGRLYEITTRPVVVQNFLKGVADRTSGDKRSHSDRMRPLAVLVLVIAPLIGKGEAAALSALNPPLYTPTVKSLTQTNLAIQCELL